MNASTLPRLRLLGAASILLVAAASAAMAQTGPESPPAGAAPAGGAAKAGEQAGAGAKKAGKPAAPSGYATESEARAHCHGSVVWVDSDHFNHYPGSREYGRRPGAFACEKG